MSRSDDHHLNGADVNGTDGGATVARYRSDGMARRQVRSRRRRYGLLALVAVALCPLVFRSLIGAGRAFAVGAEALGDLAGASLSPNGEVVALDGFFAQSKDAVTSIVDVSDGKLVSASPKGWFTFWHKWGSGTAYVETRTRRTETAIYYAPSADSPATRANIEGVSALALATSSTALDPSNRWLIVAARTGAIHSVISNDALWERYGSTDA
ncbi:MAG: hypothetical protein ABSD48_17325 [Armatimonadota bacterium]